MTKDKRRMDLYAACEDADHYYRDGCVFRQDIDIFDKIKAIVRYNNGADAPNQLTGSFYKAIAPKKQVYKPTEWNHYRMSFKGPLVKVELNGELIQDVNLDEHNSACGELLAIAESNAARPLRPT